jgi:hypothetical protein
MEQFRGRIFNKRIIRLIKPYLSPSNRLYGVRYHFGTETLCNLIVDHKNKLYGEFMNNNGGAGYTLKKINEKYSYDTFYHIVKLIKENKLKKEW